MTARERLEKAEARVLVAGFLQNGQSQDWLKKALRVSVRIYGGDSEQRIRAFMKTMWKTDFLMTTI